MGLGAGGTWCMVHGCYGHHICTENVGVFPDKVEGGSNDKLKNLHEV